MITFKIIADFEKEEQFLNGMAQRGYGFKSYHSLGIYTFQRIQPQRANFRIDYRTFSSKAQFNEYCTLFQDAGWTHVFGTRRSGTQYFLPLAGKSQAEDIFSDRESKAGRYRRFSAQCASSLLLLIAFLMILKPEGVALWNLESWYFTQGLWQMTGDLFWKAFLFETPFVLLRMAPLVLFAVMAAVYGFWAVRAKSLYKRACH